MKSKAAAHRRNWRHDLRMFAAGAGCGLLAGVLLVAALLLRYDALTWPGRLADMRGEDVRTPVLEPVAVARPTGTIGRLSRRPRSSRRPHPGQRILAR